MGWALSGILGNGAWTRPPWTDTTGPYRPAAASYGPILALIVSNTDGTPIATWCLVRTGTGYDTAAAGADARVRLLPDLSFDHVLTSPERAAIKNNADLIGATGLVLVAGDTVRVALKKLADMLDTTWDPEAQII